MSIAVRGLTRHYRRGTESITALDAIDLELYPGELAVAAGPSGSGKTTLLSILAGFDTADSGTIVLRDPLPADVPAAELRWSDLAFVPQSATLLDELTVAENIDLPARLASARGTRLPDGGAPGGLGLGELMAELEIGHLAGRYPSQTSGGEQQRTAIGRALRLRPHVLLADEPTGHQDRARVGLVLEILRRHAYAGHTVLISSHDEDVIGAADRVLTLADGRLVADSYHRIGSR
jgi:putative ABC transport system ATP-binding protein